MCTCCILSVCTDAQAREPGQLLLLEAQPYVPQAATLCALGCNTIWQAHERKQQALGPPMTLEEALLAAEAEGLVLQRSSNVTGYKHVAMDKTKPRQYQVHCHAL